MAWAHSWKGKKQTFNEIERLKVQELCEERVQGELVRKDMSECGAI